MHRGGVEVQLYSSLILTLDGVGCLTQIPCRFTPWNDPIPIVWETGCDTGPLWTVAEKISPIGFRSPDRPPSRGLLYRLRYSMFFNMQW
jgi:hypothetical protein